jgi:hypothetical protein
MGEGVIVNGKVNSRNNPQITQITRIAKTVNSKQQTAGRVNRES